MSELSMEDRARRREERRHRRREEREREEREQQMEEERRQEELPLEKSFNTSLNLNSSHKHEEDEISSPQFSRQKVPEVNLDSENGVEQSYGTKYQVSNGNGYYDEEENGHSENGYNGNGYHDSNDNSQSEGDYSSYDDGVNTDSDEDDDYHGNEIDQNDYDEEGDRYKESERQMERQVPIILEPKPVEGKAQHQSLASISHSQNGSLKVRGQYFEDENGSMFDGKELLSKLDNGLTNGRKTNGNGYHHELTSPPPIRTSGQKEAVMLRRTPRANSTQDEADKEIREAELKAAELREKRAREEEERWEEEEELRKAEHDQYKRDLEALQEKSERRKRQKEEEEKKHQEEEEERKAREAEEAHKRKEEIERRRQEAGERLRNMMNGPNCNPMRPNYNISAAIAQSRKEHKQTDEEREQERKHVIEERVPPLTIGRNITMDQLKEIARDLHQKLIKVYSARFDLEQRKKRQDYDVRELDQRIKDLTKYSVNKTKSSVVIDSGIVSKIKEQGFLTESKPKKKSFYQERNEGIASSGGVAGRLNLFQNKIDKKEQTDIRKSGSPRSWKCPEVDKCCMCNKSVYSMEKLEVNKKLYHQQCLKCAYCSKILSLSHYSLYRGDVYCKPHQRKVEWEDLQAGIKSPAKKDVNNGMDEVPVEA